MSNAIATAVLNQFLTLSDTARHLNVTRQTVARWIKMGRLPAYRIGREVLIEKSEVERLRR